MQKRGRVLSYRHVAYGTCGFLIMEIPLKTVSYIQEGVYLGAEKVPGQSGEVTLKCGRLFIPSEDSGFHSATMLVINHIRK